MKLQEQTVLVTGAAGAIGGAFVRELAGKVRALIGIDQEEESLKRLRDSVPELWGYSCDLTDVGRTQRTVEAIQKAVGVPTVLVNNAGLIHSEPLINLVSRDQKRHSLSNWRRTIDINLNAVFYLSSYIVEKLVENRTPGLIVNISSISAVGNSAQSAYAAAKAAVNALTVTWSQELAMFGIRCVSLAPGFVDTDSTRRSLSEPQIRKWMKKTPVGRLARSHEIAHALRFVIENDYVNGQVLGIDGGLRI